MWEGGKDYVVVGDVVVESNSVLTIEPDVRIFFKADMEADYYGHHSSLTLGLSVRLNRPYAPLRAR